jgi:predicted nucleic acid-binding protein
MTVLDLRRGFIDSNIWLYALLIGQNEEKTRIAKNLTLIEFNIVSIQVINEVCVNLIKKDKYNEAQIKKLISSFYANHLVVEINREILLHASDLRSRYAFSFWDGLIAASALSADAKVLYSEDMQDGLMIEKRLKIVNPFI